MYNEFMRQALVRWRRRHPVGKLIRWNQEGFYGNAEMYDRNMQQQDNFMHGPVLLNSHQLQIAFRKNADFHVFTDAPPR